MTRWGLTIDCAHPSALAGFWALALGYDPFGLPVPDEDDDDEAAFLRDPAGVGPTLSFLQVPESKVAKNRLHIDVKAGGGRQNPWEQRWPRVDPEGNEFCVV